jgi:hypothetical protein
MANVSIKPALESDTGCFVLRPDIRNLAGASLIYYIFHGIFPVRKLAMQ